MHDLMEISQFLTPTVIVALVTAVVGLIVKAVRLQSTVDSLSKDVVDHATRLDSKRERIAALEASAKDVVELKATVAAITESFTRHRENADVHFNLRTAQEVDKRMELRFSNIENQLGEIKDLVKGLAK